ncbi:hypothetical protein JTE90_004572 [Oedothorax gibbosus]|uniref:Uncharacterized protein n=1 Tax=Oedothorax gibbosus TaxID=931172 RepID=A0AAV6ULG6_9ARAC|nr:hypothetical protein JTE90_004572 [Oedothorax gibbosus]
MHAAGGFASGPPLRALGGRARGRAPAAGFCEGPGRPVREEIAAGLPSGCLGKLLRDLEDSVFGWKEICKVEAVGFEQIMRFVKYSKFDASTSQD